MGNIRLRWKKMTKEVATIANNDLHTDFQRVRISLTDLPIRVHLLAYKTGAHQLAWQQILTALDFKQTSNEMTSLTFYPRGFIKTTRYDTYFSVAIWAKKAKNLSFGLKDMYKQPLLLSQDGKLTELEILVSNKNLSQSQVEQLLANQIIYSSQVSDGFAQIYTSFQPDTNGRERYLILLPKEAALDKLELLIDLISQLENSFHLLYEPQPDVTNLVKQVSSVEKRGAHVLKEINEQLDQANTQKLKEWLKDVTRDYTDLAAINDQLSSKLSDALNLKDSLKEIFTELKEASVPGFTEISKPISTLTLRKTSDYARILNRIQTARNRRSDMIKILRTRLDILEREQAFALQCSMHETTKSQMALQKSVEGLYVFIAAFYLTELAKIVFEALKARHLIKGEPVILAALFIPVALLIALVLAGKVKLKFK